MKIKSVIYITAFTVLLLVISFVMLKGNIPAEKGEKYYYMPEMVNINSAEIEELMSINGIGEITAKRIIEYREENGDFTDIYELANIKGISEEKLYEIKDKICV